MVDAHAEFKHAGVSSESRDNTTLGRNRNMGKTIPKVKISMDFNYQID